MTGRFGIHTGVVGHGGTAADMRLEGERRGFASTLLRTSLPGLLRSAGFRTVSISPFAERHSSWTFYAGFNEMYNTGKNGMESAEEITPTVLKWIENNKGEDNWFLHVNYWDPHTPYRAPEEFGNPFEKDPLPDWYSQEMLDEHRRLVGPHKPRELAMYDNSTNPRYPRYPGELKSMDDLKKLIDGYDCGIRYMDTHIGMLFDALEKQGILEDMVIIISADHGEAMGELGIYGEHGTADHSTCRIPMIIRWPGCRAGHVDKGLHYNLDLLPTLAEAFQKPINPLWDGQSYWPAVSEGKDCGREYLVVSQCAHVCQRSVIFDHWIYMRTYHDGYHLFPREMLFDLANDPHEQKDVAKEHPDLCKQAVYYLNQWHDDMMGSMDYDVDPLWTVIKEGGPLHARGQLKAYVEYLKKTGREYAVEELKRRHPREFR